MRQSSAVRSIPRSLTATAVARRKEGPPSPAFPGARVFVVDDDASVRKSLDRLLTSVGYRVQTFETAREFLARPTAPADGPQCLILDIRMPGVSGLDLQMSLRSSGVNIPIIFSTGFGDVASSVRAMKVGAIDFLTKPIDEEELLAAVERGLTLDAEMARVDALMGVLKTRQSRLTPRENQVFSLVVTGMLNKQIAGRLGTCERTIKVHRARIMKKMEAGSVADLVRMADRLGVPPSAGRSSEARGMALT
jgi:FixJ family two-component response regulator